jgi:transcriptional regulator with XRE-family HTH domain
MPGEGQRAADRREEAEAVPRFAAAIKARREASGWSQGQVGYRAGLDAAEVSRLERGKREPRLRTIIRIARGLGVEPAELMKDLR